MGLFSGRRWQPYFSHNVTDIVFSKTPKKKLVKLKSTMVFQMVQRIRFKFNLKTESSFVAIETGLSKVDGLKWLTLQPAS